MPAAPKSNGLVEIQGTAQKEKGFCCMRLIKFLVRDAVKDWDIWHGAHLQAAQHSCPYREECSQYPKEVQQPPIQRAQPVQLEFNFNFE